MRVFMIASIVLAIGTTIWTWWPEAEVKAQTNSKEGTLLNASGKEVYEGSAASLEVYTWDKDAKSAKKFEVKKAQDRWIIPSHYDYPADGGTRVGQTAGEVLNVPRGPLKSSKADTHADYGLIDPTKAGLSEKEDAIGKRVTLKDEGGATLVDLIIGKKTEISDVYYVREANSEEVYTAKLNPDISTKFKDWVETDLLKITRGDIRKITILDYSVDEAKGGLKQRSATQFSKSKDASDWTSPQTPKGLVVNEDSISDLLNEVTSLRLEGVRPFNKMWLTARGFFPQPKGGLLANEGAIAVVTKDGIHYNLFFGEIALGDEEEKAEYKKEDAADKEKDKDKADGEGDEHNRYMALFLVYDEGSDEDKMEDILKKAQEEAKNKGKKKDPKEKLKPSAGELKAQTKQQRFQQFFYVISDASFKKLRPAVDKLFKDKEVKKEDLPGEKIGDDVSLEKGEDDLQYADLKQGDGDEAAEGDEVEVHYTGWLEKDGTEFDSSRKSNTPFKFTLGKGMVIQGWDKGVKGMKVGGKRKLVIPHKLGYGERGSPPKIPGKARLVFDVELLKVNKKNVSVTPVEKAPAEKAPEAMAPDAKAPEGKAPEAKEPESKASESNSPEAKPEPKEATQPEGKKEKKVEKKVEQKEEPLKEEAKKASVQETK